jgi:hypothetical protein
MSILDTGAPFEGVGVGVGVRMKMVEVLV